MEKTIPVRFDFVPCIRWRVQKLVRISRPVAPGIRPAVVRYQPFAYRVRTQTYRRLCFGTPNIYYKSRAVIIIRARSNGKVYIRIVTRTKRFGHETVVVCKARCDTFAKPGQLQRANRVSYGSGPYIILPVPPARHDHRIYLFFEYYAAFL